MRMPFLLWLLLLLLSAPVGRAQVNLCDTLHRCFTEWVLVSSIFEDCTFSTLPNTTKGHFERFFLNYLDTLSANGNQCFTFHNSLHEFDTLLPYQSIGILSTDTLYLKTILSFKCQLDSMAGRAGTPTPNSYSNRTQHWYIQTSDAFCFTGGTLIGLCLKSTPDLLGLFYLVVLRPDNSVWQVFQFAPLCWNPPPY